LKRAALRDSSQLPLDIGPGGNAVLPERLRPMLPVDGERPFDDPDWFFEPWWAGASTLAYVEDGRIRLQTEHLADPLEAFPELASISGQFRDDGLIVEGALLVLDDDGRPDADLLRGRLAGQFERRGVAALVASDLLYASGQAQVDLPFEERRARLGRVLVDGERAVVSRGIRGEGTTLAEAVGPMGVTEISARLLAGTYRPGARDESWLRIPIEPLPAITRRPLLAVLQRLPL
jgi:bifunctional non-homologous end joining protein LigD